MRNWKTETLVAKIAEWEKEATWCREMFTKELFVNSVTAESFRSSMQTMELKVLAAKKILRERNAQVN